MNKLRSKKLKVSVIATVLNEESSINELLDALTSQIFPATEIVIVDGGSTDTTWKKLLERRKKFPLQLKIRQIPGNRSVGRNAAIRLASSELIAITDAGCFPEPTWLAELVAAIPQPQPDKVVIAGYYTAYPKTPFAEAAVPYVFVMPDKVNPTTFLPATRSMLISKTVWKEFDGFDPTLSDNEDFAFAKKLQKNKQEIVFAGQARVVWQPPESLRSFHQMIFRFARGDAFALIWRPKILFIFLRYVLWLILCCLGMWAACTSILLFIFYLVWSVKKNLKYVPNGWYWLPILQLSADIAVMYGTVVGLTNRWQVDHRSR